MLLPPGSVPVDSAEHAACHAAWIGSYALARQHLAAVDDPTFAVWLGAYLDAAVGDLDAGARAAGAIWPFARWPIDVAVALTAGAARRQARRYREAERWDRLALSRSRLPVQRSAALTSLAADAVGHGDPDACARRLERAVGPRDARTVIRVAWVGCELALLSGNAAEAVGRARVALYHATASGARRHIAKSLLFLAVAQRDVEDPAWHGNVADAQRHAANIGARGLAAVARVVAREGGRPVGG